MADETSSLVLEHLRHIRARVNDIADEMKSQGTRKTEMERHWAGFHASDVDQTHEISRLKVRVERIEQRLDLHEG